MNVPPIGYRKPHQETIAQRLMGETYLPSRSRVFNHIAHLQGDRPQTEPRTYDQLADDTDLSRPTYGRSLRQLVDEGHIIIIRLYDEAGHRAANAYRIVRRCFADLRELLRLKKIREAARRRILAKLAEKRRAAALSLTDDTTLISISIKENGNPLDRSDPAYLEQMLALPDRPSNWKQAGLVF